MVEISVIIPVYNVEKYLEKCLDSVISQTFEDIEIICVNDGSTDGSLNILERYANNDNRINIISQENKGLGAARNMGLKHVKGNFIFFVDPDDYLEPNAFKEVYENAILNNSDMVLFKYNQFNEESKIVKGYDFSIFNNIDYNNFTFDYKQIKNEVINIYFAVWMNFYKKEFLDRYDDFYFQEGIAFEDVLFHVKAFLRAKRISFVPNAFYNYRLAPNSISRTSSNGYDIITVCNSVENFLIDNDYAKEFSNELILFKVTQLLQFVFLINSPNYYNKIKREFKKIDHVNGILTGEKLLLFNTIIDSKDYPDFLKKYYNK